MTNRSRHLLLAAGLILALTSPALATQEPSQDGVWVGSEQGNWTQATVSISGDTLVFVDTRTVIVGTMTGPLRGGQWDLLVTSMVDRRGKSRVGKRKGPLRTKASSRIDGRTLEICGTAPGSDTPRPKLALAAGERRAKGVRCFKLSNVTPTPAPPKPRLHECLSECRQQNQMRAVGAEVIEADCRALCGATEAP